MRHLVCFVSVLAGCQGSVRWAAPSAPNRASQPAVRISATAVGDLDVDGNLLVLVTVTNGGSERLVVAGGGADDDWVTSFSIWTEGIGGFGTFRGTLDGPKPGNLSCPRPAYDLILAPGASVGRLQRLQFDDRRPGNAPYTIGIRVRLFFTSGALTCRPLELLEREVNVALVPATAGAGS